MIQGSKEPVERKSSRTVAREAFFLEFAKIIRTEFPTVPLMVTGGFRTRTGMRRALEDQACDMIGIARPAVLNPLLPVSIILNAEVSDEDARLYVRKMETPWRARLSGIKSAGSGAESV